MFGWTFRKYDPNAFSDNPFENLLKIFKELLMFTSGNVSESLKWITQLDTQYNLTTPEYGIADFIRELKEKGYIKEDGKEKKMVPAAKMELELRRKALDDVFDDLKKSKRGDHKTNAIGLGDEITSEIKPVWIIGIIVLAVQLQFCVSIICLVRNSSQVGTELIITNDIYIICGILVFEIF